MGGYVMSKDAVRAAGGAVMLLLGALLLLLVAMVLAPAAEAAKPRMSKSQSIEGMVWTTHQVFAHCVILLDVIGRDGYLDVTPVYFPPEDIPLGEPKACGEVSEGMRIRVRGIYDNVAQVPIDDLTPQNASDALVHGFIEETVEKAVRDWIDDEDPVSVQAYIDEIGALSEPVRYFRARSFAAIAESSPSLLDAGTKDLEQLRRTIPVFLNDWYIAQNERRFWSHVTADAPLRKYPDAYAGAFNGSSKPDPSTFTSWGNRMADKSFCRNNPTDDGFCVVNPESGFARNLKYEKMIRELLVGRVVSTRDRISVVLYDVDGEGYEHVVMFTFWIKRSTGFWGRLIGKTFSWQYYTFAAF